MMNPAERVTAPYTQKHDAFVKDCPTCKITKKFNTKEDLFPIEHDRLQNKIISILNEVIEVSQKNNSLKRMDIDLSGYESCALKGFFAKQYGVEIKISIFKGISGSSQLMNIAEIRSSEFELKWNLLSPLFQKSMGLVSPAFKQDVSNNGKLGENLWKQTEEKKQCDVTFKCKNNERCFAHSSVLYSQSEHFKKIFDDVSDLSGESNIDYEKEIMTAYLEFLYLGKSTLADAFSVEPLNQLLLLATEYECKKLMEICSNLIYMKANFEERKKFIIELDDIDSPEMLKMICNWAEEDYSLRDSFRKGIYGIKKAKCEQLLAIAAEDTLPNVEKMLNRYADFLFAGKK